MRGRRVFSNPVTHTYIYIYIYIYVYINFRFVAITYTFCWFPTYIENNFVDALFASTKCKRKLQFPSPSNGRDDPVKKIKKRKLLKTDSLEIVSFIATTL